METLVVYSRAKKSAESERERERFHDGVTCRRPVFFYYIKSSFVASRACDLLNATTTTTSERAARCAFLYVAHITSNLRARGEAVNIALHTQANYLFAPRSPLRQRNVAYMTLRAILRERKNLAYVKYNIRVIFEKNFLCARCYFWFYKKQD